MIFLFQDMAMLPPTTSDYGRRSRRANLTWTTSIMGIISAPSRIETKRKPSPKFSTPMTTCLKAKNFVYARSFFFVSATLQDIIARYLKAHETFNAFPEKVAIQLNDTHPACDPGID